MYCFALHTDFLVAFCAYLLLFLTDAAVVINDTDCTGHARVVNATVLEVQCLPAVNTVELPVVDATWELLIADTRYTTACYKVVLFRNQSIAYYEELPVSYRQAISTRLLVNASMSEAECDSSYKAAFNTTRSSLCCSLRFQHFLAVDKDRGTLIAYAAANDLTKTFLHRKPATCSVTGSNGRTASSSFTITTQNGEPNCMHYMSCL